MLTVDEMNYLRGLFSFNGIPFYVYVNPKGEVEETGFQPGNFPEKLKALGIE